MVYVGTVCKKWIHKQCSGVCVDLSLVVSGINDVTRQYKKLI